VTATTRATDNRPGLGTPQGIQGRLRGRGVIGTILQRPETTAIVGTVLVFIYFTITAGSNGFLSLTATQNYLAVAAELAILAAPVSLLLIAGEFDLSLGAAIGATGIATVYPVVAFGAPLWLGLLVGLAIGCLIGAFNGLLVAFSGIPSFLVTLASMFMLEGLTLVVTKSLTGQTHISGIAARVKNEFTYALFAGKPLAIPVSVYWAVAIVAVCAWLLQKTKFGNWIYASGGNPQAARRVGVPVKRVKIILFIMTSAAAATMALLSTLTVDQAQVTRGTGMEFEAAVAAVIGGGLIGGGFGSPIGAGIGALLFGLVSQGFFFTDIDSNWFRWFLGAMLLIAVAINQYARTVSARNRG
jgi:simple sugar transport system permease protein